MYIASLGQEACVIMDVFSCIPFSEKFFSYLGFFFFFATTRLFVQQQSFCRQVRFFLKYGNSASQDPVFMEFL